MRGFSDADRERIREELVRTARDLLVRYGPEKTTVADITEPVGIAKPTFYQFFDAKSDLYLLILHEDLEAFEASLRSTLEDIDDPRKRLEAFFRCYVEFGESNEFIQQMFIKRDYREVLGNLSADQIAEMEREEMAMWVPIVEDIQARSTGPIAALEPTTVLGLMGSSLGLLVLHEDDYVQHAAELEEVEDDYYRHIQAQLIETLARGLTADG